MQGIGSKVFKLLSNNVGAPIFSRSFSAVKSYTVKEVEIATPSAFIAGKLWQGNEIVGSNTAKETPILAVHGWLDNANSFDPLLSTIMTPGRTVYAFDLPGHGRSPLSTCGYFDGLPETMMAISRVMVHFGWNKVVLLGHSMGSIISFNFAGIFPEFVSGYIGLDIVRSVPRDHVETIRKMAFGINKIEKKLASKSEPPSYSYDEILQRTYIGRKKSVDLEACKILLERGAVALPDNKYRFSHNLRVTIPVTVPTSDITSREIAKNIKCPVCIIKGDPGEYYEPREAFDGFTEYLKQNLADFEFHYVPGTHHFHLNDPSQTAEIVTKFLETKVV